jgi:uncharacterized RDD family membrane protein YckC
MSSTPERDAAGQWSGGTQQGDPPGAPSQGNAPGQEHVGSAPSQGSAPGQEHFGSAPSQGSAPGQEHVGSAPSQGSAPGQEHFDPSGGGSGQPQGGGTSAYQRDSRRGRALVTEAETRVTWRRIFQYWVDAFLVSIVPYLVSIPFDRSGSTSLHIIGGMITFVLFLVIGFWYWIIRPHSHNGQTFAMKWFGLRVISKDGGPATMVQYFIRWISLIFDAFPWVWPLTGLLGLIVMLCSRYRQRGGDHLGRTLVISSGSGPASQYALGGAPGAVSDPVPPEPYGRPDNRL